MRAVVLVGGEGTRLRPLTYTIPKPLLPIVNQPLLERQLIWLAAHGVDEVVLSMGYLRHAFEAHFPDGRFGEISIRYAVEPEPLGTAGAIRFAAEGVAERFVVCNGDVLTTLDLTSLVRLHDERSAQATIHLARVDDPSAFGVVPTDENGAVSAFVEKPASDAAATNWINAGTYVLDPSVLDCIPPGVAMSVEREVFPRLLENPGRVFAMRSPDYWLDIGTPESYLVAHADVLAGSMGTPPLAGVRALSPGVWVGDDADLGDATLVSPIVVGSGVKVGSGSRIESTTIGDGCVVDAGVTVVGSVILPDARLGEGARVVGSIVGPHAVLEPEVAITDRSIIGAGAVVTARAEMSGARVHVPRP